MKPLVYIAGPFSPSNGKTMQENTFFAERLGKYAQELGYAPVVPHSSILRGVYGDDGDPSERVEGTLSTLALMCAVLDSKDSELWVITDELGEMSEGTLEEFNIWQSNNPEATIRTQRAVEWERIIREHYLNKLVEETPYDKQENK